MKELVYIHKETGQLVLETNKSDTLIIYAPDNIRTFFNGEYFFGISGNVSLDFELLGEL